MMGAHPAACRDDTFITLGDISMSTNFLAGSRSWWVLVLFGLLAIAFGAFAFAAPSRTLIALVWTFGILSLAEGVVSLIAVFFTKSAELPFPRWLLVLYALISIAFGVLAIGNPQAMKDALILLLAAWLVIAGIFRIIYAFRARNSDTFGAWLIGVSGVLALVFGILFFVYPTSAVLALTIWIGIGALIYGVLQVVAGLLVKKYAPKQIA